MTSVSVVMPTYRRTRYLRRALESALAQTWTDLELFVSDNSEDDAVEQIVRAYPDPRIRYRRNPRNLGGTANFLTAVRDATADVVACLHDDDVWEPDFLDRVARPLVEDERLTLAFSDFDVIDEDGAVRAQETDYLTRRRHRLAVPGGRLRLGEPTPMAAVLADGLCQPCYAAAFRRRLLDGRTMPAELDPLYDLWINELACRDGVEALYVPAVLSHYRTHGQSQTAAAPFLAQSTARYQVYVDDPDLAPARPDLELFLGRLHLHQAAVAMRGGDRAGYRRELLAAVPYTLPERRPVLRLLAGTSALMPLVRRGHAALQWARSRVAGLRRAVGGGRRA